MKVSVVQATYVCAAIAAAAALMPQSVNSQTLRASASSTTTTTTETNRLRGSSYTRTRTVYHDKEEGQEQPLQPLVDPHQHKIVKLRGTGSHGEVREIEIDVTALQERVNDQVEHKLRRPENKHFQQFHTVSSSYGHSEGHDNGDSNHEPNQQPSTQDNQQQQEQKLSSPTHNKSSNYEPHHTRIVLPAGLEEHYNHSQYEELHGAPFEIYEAAFGESLDPSTDSFPVFIVPEWRNTTGVFSGFSRTATPLVFENMQFLLTWQDVQGASTGVDDDLMEFMSDNDFQSTLLIGKAYSPTGRAMTFLGLLVSYFQGTKKNVLVPFAKLDHFFDDASEQNLMSDEVKHMELEALHEMLEEQRSNSTNNELFYHPAMNLTDERKKQLQQLESLHFRKLYQLLIRRTFLFSFGYADCLKTEPHVLRECLDDTYSIIMKMETTVRGAMDEQIVQELAEINDTFHSKVGEACFTATGVDTGMNGICANFGDLGAYVATTSKFF
jgi:hypothetical protein